MGLLLTSFGEAATYALYILIAVLLLLLMITVHEAGHYFAGKIFGFGIEEFSIGFGPKIFSRTKKNGEKFSVRRFIRYDTIGKIISYIHMGGKIGVLVALESDAPAEKLQALGKYHLVPIPIQKWLHQHIIYYQYQ